MVKTTPVMIHGLLEKEVPSVGPVGIERGIRATEVNEFDGISSNHKLPKLQKLITIHVYILVLSNNGILCLVLSGQ